MSNHYSLLPSTTKAPRYSMPLTVLGLLIVFAPIATRTGSAYGVEALFDLVLVAGVYSAASRGRRQSLFIVLTLLTLALASAMATVVWIALAIAIVVIELFHQREVTTNMILGAIVAYFLAAVAFAYLFEILELSQPGSFAGIPQDASLGCNLSVRIYFQVGVDGAHVDPVEIGPGRRPRSHRDLVDLTETREEA